MFFIYLDRAGLVDEFGGFDIEASFESHEDEGPEEGVGQDEDEDPEAGDEGCRGRRAVAATAQPERSNTLGELNNY